jgi:DNA-binding transcriptional ArsR family regulator
MNMESCDLLCLDLEVAEEVRAALDRDRAASIAGVIKALADPTRLLIVQALTHRELCGCDLAWVCGCSEKLVSHHLGRLRREGLVSSRREGKIVFAALTERGQSTLAMAEAVAA